MSHGAKCICQICTCGRHKCPHDRNASSFQLGDGKSHLTQEKTITQSAFESSSYQKSQRATPNRHHSTISSLFTEENSTGTAGTHTRTIKSAEYKATRQNGEQHVIEKRESQRETTQLPPIHQTENVRASHSAGKEKNSRTSIQQALQQTEERASSAGSARTSSADKSRTVQSGARKTVSINEQSSGYNKTYRNSSQIFEARRLHQVKLIASGNENIIRNLQQAESTDSNSGDSREGHGSTSREAKDHNSPLIGLQKSDKQSTQKQSHTVQITTPGRQNSNSHNTVSKGIIQGKTNSVIDEKAKNLPHIAGVRTTRTELTSHRILQGAAHSSLNRTQNQEDFIYRPGDSPRVHKQHVGNNKTNITVLQGDGKQFEARTQNQEDFTHISGERYAKKVPTDNKILQGDGQQFGARTQNQEDFTHISGERYAKKVPADNKILQGDGQQEMVNSSRLEPRTQKDFTHISGERYAKKVPADNKILQGDGQQFEARTQNQEDFTHISGERYAKKVPTDNKILQGDGQQFEARTQNQEDFTHISGERYAKKVPTDNKILQGDGQQFVARTQNREDFKTVKISRSVKIVPVPHKFEQSENAKITGSSLYKDDFVDFSSDIVSQSGINLGKWKSTGVSRGGRSHLYETSSVIEDSDSGFEGYNFVSGSKLSTSHAGYLSQDAGSSYDIDFQYRPVPCIAGELLESIRRNHSNTLHYDFNQCDSGHHFYREKTILEEDETSETINETTNK
ncbi:hypothetical protein CRE_15437 [Caenorhabditis remanei]|uniref:Uncharacterized protein n=1 Tax=Caenorhabditis remanei TaxID=31234 RepID=E3MCC3_CAERE|nr:hypothetical protein CRE_15437 [Caenorhabditis remanei]